MSRHLTMQRSNSDCPDYTPVVFFPEVDPPDFSPGAEPQEFHPELDPQG